MNRGRGFSSAIFLLEASFILWQECLHSIPSLLCLQDFGQREMARMLRRVQEGILFLLWFVINVFIRQAADGWHFSKGPFSIS